MGRLNRRTAPGLGNKAGLCTVKPHQPLALRQGQRHHIDISADQRLRCGPRRHDLLAKGRLRHIHHPLGHHPVGRQLAPGNREHAAWPGPNLILARNLGSRLALLRHQRPHTRPSRHDVGSAQRIDGEPQGRRRQQIVDILPRDLRPIVSVQIEGIGCAQIGHVALGHRKHAAPISRRHNDSPMHR